MLFTIITSFNPLQPDKAQSPILVTEFGMVIDVKPMHPLKASHPILVTEFGMVTDVKPLHFSKARYPILVTVYSFPSTVIELGITTSPEYLSFQFTVTSAVLPSEFKL